ncbi:MAG: hypothetical protein HRS57_02555 [Mycoplasmataceae bacterium]|nr:hypothetical protein [Mycoplasmataceae bacterium]
MEISTLINEISTFDSAPTSTVDPVMVGVFIGLGIISLLLAFWSIYMSYIAHRDVKARKMYGNAYDKDAYSWWERNRFGFWIMATCILITLAFTFFIGFNPAINTITT